MKGILSIYIYIYIYIYIHMYIYIYKYIYNIISVFFLSFGTVKRQEPSPEMVSRWEILDRRGARLALVPRGSGLTLGRHRGCDICVDTSSVSARHCLITCLTGSKILGLEMKL